VDRRCLGLLGRCISIASTLATPHNGVISSASRWLRSRNIADGGSHHLANSTPQMNSSLLDWEVYERLVARMIADQLSTDYCVTPNAHVIGVISERSRQIDVLIDSRHQSDASRRIIVDAKRRTRKVDVSDVEAFLGLMNDVTATHGYLVSPAGYTKAAERRAQESVSLRILPLDRLEHFDPSTWLACTDPRCSRGLIFWDGYPKLEVTLKSLSVDRKTKHLSFVHYVGKCDRCGRFHVMCVTCGDLISPRNDDPEDVGHRCRCKMPWFWITSIERDEEGRRSSELHAVRAPSTVTTVSRRSL
jgi:hypothetical protein